MTHRLVSWYASNPECAGCTKIIRHGTTHWAVFDATDRNVADLCTSCAPVNESPRISEDAEYNKYEDAEMYPGGAGYNDVMGYNDYPD